MMFLILSLSASAQDAAPVAITDSSDALIGRPASGFDPAQCGVLLAGHPSAKRVVTIIDAQGRSVVACVDADTRRTVAATELELAKADTATAIAEGQARVKAVDTFGGNLKTAMMVGAPAFADVENGVYATGTAAPVAASARVVDAWAQRPAMPVGYGYGYGYSEARVNAAVIDLVAGNAAYRAEVVGAAPTSAYDDAVSRAFEAAAR